jgi:DNA-binding winged helix-turn-helix (wHTH) protein
MAVGFYGNLRFGPFELLNRERVLRRDGVVLPLGGSAFDILIHPAECPGELIAKQELLDRVWSVRSGSYKMRIYSLAP